MSGFKKIKIKIITQWRATSAFGWGQRCFVETLHIIGLKSKLFFTGVNRNSPKLQEGIDILTLYLLIIRADFSIPIVQAYGVIPNLKYKDKNYSIL